jgi:hypothetical protein
VSTSTVNASTRLTKSKGRLQGASSPRAASRAFDCKDGLSLTSRQHQRPCIAGLERWSETMYSPVPKHCSDALRPRSPIENPPPGQTQATIYLALLCCAVCYATARILAIAIKDAVTVVDKPILRRKGYPYTAAKSCAPGDKNTVQRLRQLRELVSITGFGTNTDAALEHPVNLSFSTGVAGTEAARELRVLGRLRRKLWGIVTGAYTLLHSPSLSARFIRPSRTCGSAVWLLSTQPCLAVAVVPEDLSAVGSIPNPTTGPLTTANPVRTNPNGPAPAEWSFPILCVVILAVCWFLARLKRWELSNVMGTLAAIYWYLWLYLIRYPDISPWYPWS